MPRGKHLPKETVAAIVADYQAGMTGPDLAAKYEVVQSTVTKLITRELGLVRPVGRPRRPPPMKGQTKLDDAGKARALELYRELGSLDKVAAELNVSFTTVKKTLKALGETLNSPTRPRTKTPEFFCKVCGELIKAHACYHSPTGVIVPARSCGKAECKAALAFGAVEPDAPVSRKEIRNDKGGLTAQGRANFMKRQKLENLILADRLPVDILALMKLLPLEQIGEYEAQFELTEDDRGIGRPGEQASVWGELSRVPVYMRLVARDEGHAAIQLVLRGEETVFDRFIDKFFADKDQIIAVSQTFRPLLAWRCSCPDQTTWTLDTVVDLPDEVGVHGVCSTCGACALYIRRED